MSSIDDRIVQMEFNNTQFQKGVGDTQKSLDGLKKGLDLSGSAKNLDNLQSAGNRFNLGHISDSVDKVSSRFSAWGIVGATVISDLTYKALNAGLSIAKSFTIDPITDGFKSYETQINATQTILANTSAAGTKLPAVTAALAKLNTYANLTVYNFSQMASNIGTFTAAGVGLKTSVESIKGIANLAAFSGSTADQASTAMYQLSQAIAAGRVKLQDWNSVVNAGLGGKTFQTALINTARVNGVQIDKMIKDQGGFRNSLQKGWLTSKILTQTLAQFTGDLSKKQLISMGYSEKEAEAVLKMGKTAVNAATKIKTLSQLTDALHEEVATAYAAIFKVIFGNITDATTLFSAIHNTAENSLTGPILQLAKILEQAAALGARTQIIDAFGNAFKFLGAIIKPIKEALNEIFPEATARQIEAFAQGIDIFSKGLKVSGKTATDIRRTFAGLFAIFDIGIQIVKGVLSVFGVLFKQTTKGSGSFLDFTAKIGDLLVKLDDAIKEGTGFTAFFTELGKIVSVPIAFIEDLAKAIGELASGMSFQKITDNFGKGMDNVRAKVQPLAAVADVLVVIFTKFYAAMKRAFDFIAPFAKAAASILGQLGDNLINAFKTADYNKILDGINVGLFAGLLLLVHKFLKNGLTFHLDSGSSGFFSSIKEAFEGLTGTLKSMQQNLKANVLLKIAGALAILTASIFVLSTINSAALLRATGALGAMFAELSLSMLGFVKIAGNSTFAKLPILAASMVLVASAMLILAGAVKVLSSISWAGLVKGLGGVLILLGGISIAIKSIAKSNIKGLIGAGVGMIAIAFAIRILVSAVKELGSLDVKSLAKGLVSVGVLLGELLIFTRSMGDPKRMILTGAGLVLLAVSLNIMSKALTAFGKMNSEEIAKAMIVLGLSLSIISGALETMSGAISGAISLVLVAAALDIIAPAFKSFAQIDWEGIGKIMVILFGALTIISAAMDTMTAALPGAAALIVVAAALAIMVPVFNAFAQLDWEGIGKIMVVLFGALTIIAAAMIAMIVALPGAAALVVVAAALAVLAPVLLILGNMSWDEIVRGLVTLAGVFAVIGVAGLLLIPVIPALLGLGVAIALLGIGIAAAGVGVFLFATGLTALSVAGVAGAAGITIVFKAILGLIPLALTELGDGIVALAGVITKGAPAIIGALVAVLSSLLDGIKKLAPKIISTIGVLVVGLAQEVSKDAPKLYSAWLSMMLGMLKVLANHIGKFVDAGVNVAIAFLNGISRNVSRLVNAGISLVIHVVNGVANGIRSHTKQMNAAGVNLAEAIVDGMTSGLSIQLDALISAATNIARGVLNVVKTILGIHSPSTEFIKIGQFVMQGFYIGLTGSQDQITSAFQNLQDMVTSLLSSSADDITTYKQKITDLKNSVSQDSASIAAQRKTIAQDKTLQKSNEAVTQAKVNLESLTNARKKDNSALAAAEKARSKAKTSSARDSAQLRIDQTRDNLSTNAAQIKAAKTRLATATAAHKNNTTVQLAEAKLKKLTAARAKDQAAIKTATSELANATTEQQKASVANDLLNGKLSKQEAQVESLSGKYDDLTTKINDAQTALTDATKTRDDYNASITSQYSTLEDITDTTTLSSYVSDTQKQIAKTQQFASQLQKLRSEGLNDENYQKFLAEGTDAMPFLEQLLDSGKGGVKEINSLADSLDSTAAKLGKTASTSLYQAAVDSAAGIVKGLQNQQAAIKKEMETIAESMVDSVKKALGIKSPSKEFAIVGGYSIDGLVEGLQNGSKNLKSATSDIGDTAISGLKDSLSNINSVVSDNMDVNPTIAPVLDLSGVKKSAAGIGDILGTGNTISVDSSYSSAASAANGYTAAQQAIIDAKNAVASEPAKPVALVTYNQYNTSPKALPAAEIYRKTKSQLATTKGAVNK